MDISNAAQGRGPGQAAARCIRRPSEMERANLPGASRRPHRASPLCCPYFAPFLTPGATSFRATRPALPPPAQCTVNAKFTPYPSSTRIARPFFRSVLHRHRIRHPSTPTAPTPPASFSTSRLTVGPVAASGKKPHPQKPEFKNQQQSSWGIQKSIFHGFSPNPGTFRPKVDKYDDEVKLSGCEPHTNPRPKKTVSGFAGKGP